jgi:hypothetical protein
VREIRRGEQDRPGQGPPPLGWSSGRPTVTRVNAAPATSHPSALASETRNFVRIGDSPSSTASRACDLGDIDLCVEFSVARQTGSGVRAHSRQCPAPRCRPRCPRLQCQLPARETVSRSLAETLCDPTGNRRGSKRHRNAPEDGRLDGGWRRGAAGGDVRL